MVARMRATLVLVAVILVVVAAGAVAGAAVPAGQPPARPRRRVGGLRRVGHGERLRDRDLRRRVPPEPGRRRGDRWRHEGVRRRLGRQQQLRDPDRRRDRLGGRDRQRLRHRSAERLPRRGRRRGGLRDGDRGLPAGVGGHAARHDNDRSRDRRRPRQPDRAAAADRHRGGADGHPPHPRHDRRHPAGRRLHGRLRGQPLARAHRGRSSAPTPSPASPTATATPPPAQRRKGSIKGIKTPGRRVKGKIAVAGKTCKAGRRITVKKGSKTRRQIDVPSPTASFNIKTKKHKKGKLTIKVRRKTTAGTICAPVTKKVPGRN